MRIRVEGGHPLPAKQAGGIEERVPMRLCPRRPRPLKFSGLTAALLRMDLGDSVFLRGVSSGVAHPMLRHAVKQGRSFAVRQSRQGTRVWLIAVGYPKFFAALRF